MRSISLLHAYKYISLLFLLLFLAAAPVVAQWVPLNPVQAVSPEPDGAMLVLQSGFLRFQVCSDSVVHVVYSLERDVPQRPDNLIIKKSWPKADFSLLTDDHKLITLTTSRLKIEITRADSSIIFYDSTGHKLTQENSRTLTPTEVIAAWKAGSDFVKIFPTGHVGGVQYVRALKVPLPQIPLIATGGVNQLTASDFILAGATAIGVGGELLPKEALHFRQEDRIRELAGRFLGMVRDARSLRDTYY